MIPRQQSVKQTYEQTPYKGDRQLTMTCEKWCYQGIKAIAGMHDASLMDTQWYL